MPVFERMAGGHAAERVRPAPGTDDEAAYAALADDPASGWRRIPDQEPAPAPAPKAAPRKRRAPRGGDE